MNVTGCLLLLLLIVGPVPLFAATNNHETGISLAVDDVPVTQILQALAEQKQVNLVMAPGIAQRLSLHLTNIPWQQALESVAHAANLRWEKRGAVLNVWPGDSPAASVLGKPPASINAIKSGVKTQREVFALSHASAVDLGSALKASEGGLLSTAGRVTVDERTNRLLVDDTRSALRALRSWVVEMDRPVGQVELSAHIVTMTREGLNELGVKWSRKGRAEKTGELVNLPATAGTSLAGFNIGRIGGRMLELELSALERKQQLAFVASPRLLAAHRQTASIKQGSEIPYQSGDSDRGRGQVAFREAVLGMEVMPTVLPQRRIRLKLRISQNMPGQKLQQAEGEALIIEKQEIETQVEVREGETLALGGIFQHSRRMESDRVPLLGSLPVVGPLFRHDGRDESRRELVVFITPRLIDAG
ncbi:secretin N-terminal domain-containing protein [Erwinia sp. HR93]|uniref:secretin N-terminal domain-containing protein n=1 Tax=Erwinia sp. HR93 TaxID=3094840 RepID=UPI002ADEE370|nr:secretin N-terminal domain-containing protein [Erwinia sp. HR93]MEA1063108.1 secretin N-terminal domain-containing protein [Erwinia sp. HR93]